jgi:DNA-binding GntR family transcriptional regulator
MTAPSSERTRSGSALVRKKTSSAVVDYVLGEIFAGRLRSGDRIDIDDIGRALDVSRIPVREALVILERDGIVSTRYHRGVYVEVFDAASILDDFEIVGVLSGIAVRRLAENPDPEAIARLRQLIEELQEVKSDDVDEVFRVVQEILTVEHRAGGSRRLRAELRAFTGFLPAALQIRVGRGHKATVNAHARVVRAIVAGDGDKAAQYRLDDFRSAGRDVVRELEHRGVLD